MLAVILIWLYVIATSYLTGYGFLSLLTDKQWMKRDIDKKKKSKYSIHFKENYMVTGIVLVTVYAQIVSLFTKVGLGANIALVLVCILIAVYYREEIYADAVSMFYKLRTKGNGLIYLLVFLVMAYGASHGVMHYDSDLYHAQAIHWIEDYGIVRGLGNLHVRLAYNSAAFPLSALYSFSFLGGQSYHVMAGFFALLLAWQCVDIKNVVRRGHFIVSDFARLAAIYYLFNIYDEMVSPASDYFLSILVFYCVIHWLDINIKHEKSFVPYILLALLGIYAITIKLSAAPMIILSVIPIYKLMHNRTKEKMKALGISVAMALIITIPFFIRNIIISGWVLYPVTFLDFFGFDWEIPKGLAAYDALEIKTFGRGYTDVATYGSVPFLEWIRHWFDSITGINKIVIILDIISLVAFIAYVVYFAVALAEKKYTAVQKFDKAKVFEMSHRSMLNMADFITIGAMLTGCLLFWLFSAPLVRYGVVYMWLMPAVILGRMLIVLYNRIDKRYQAVIINVFLVIFAAWMIYKTVNVAVEDHGRFNAHYLLTQQDYGEYETETFELSGNTFYYPKEGDRIGYYAFPSATHDVTDEVELMGSSIENGFKSIQVK